MTKEIQNRINMLFPHLSNRVDDMENSNTVATEELWGTVSTAFADKVKKIIAPLDGLIMDITPDLAVKNPDALPVVQVPTINSMGEVIKNASSWEDTAVDMTYTNVQMARLSRPFSLTYADLQHGETVTNKVVAAAETVAQGVISELNTVLSTAVEAENLTDFSAEAVTAIAGSFDNDECNALVLSPAQYAKIVPTSALGLNPESEGVYGVNRIYKSTGLGEVTAMTKNSVAGAIATPAILEAHHGDCDIRLIGDIAGFPLLLKSKWDSFAEKIKCSVEVLCGFAVVNAAGVRRYTVGEQPEPEPTEFGNGPENEPEPSEFGNGPEED